MKKLFAIVLCIVFEIGCTGFRSLVEQRQDVSAAHVGCNPTEIEIINRGNWDWTAICKGKKFYCTVAPSASCREELK